MTLLRWLSAEARAELDALIDARIAAALAQRERERAPKRWATAAEVGVLLGISTRAVYRRAARGRIPESAIRHSGRRLAFDLRAIDRFLEQT